MSDSEEVATVPAADDIASRLERMATSAHLDDAHDLRRAAEMLRARLVVIEELRKLLTESLCVAKCANQYAVRVMDALIAMEGK